MQRTILDDMRAALNSAELAGKSRDRLVFVMHPTKALAMRAAASPFNAEVYMDTQGFWWFRGIGIREDVDAHEWSLEHV